MSLTDAERVILVGNAWTTNLLTVGVAALVGYDYVLTVQREARLFWKRKVTVAAILFFSNRYLALFYYVGLAYYRCLNLPFPGCEIQDYIDISLRYLEYFPWAGSIFIRGGQIIGDAVVIAVTWKATWHARSEVTMSGLMRVMYMNGTTYFLVLLVLNILHILFIFLPNGFLHIPLTNTSYVAKLSEPITSLLISRFIFDLHETNRAMARGGNLTTIEIMSSDIDIVPSSAPAVGSEWSGGTGTFGSMMGTTSTSTIASANRRLDPDPTV
ncbi:hypothetical protein GSI_15490 [Ganoderma sinense ZZ0214-1]|uniref:DUF6533 domain-containing protein n=1 Tax=Ganoderma sinense ZZ0214-1 TaxID=1077348 RepID=A0A2G8RMQ3_9APHY|nr:hypothetical protein GSI_15490 [Ganoderma sinense ZZ0214-1]